MKEYILRETTDGLLLLTKEEKQVALTDILQIYPQRRVYALHGQMGAGKTTLVRTLLKQMGVEDVVNSPTFAIVNVYERQNDTDSVEDLYHFDCYRLKTIQEALDLGAEEYLYSGRYCFIEWPEMIDEILPEETVEVEIIVNDDGQRLLRINLK